MQTHITLIDERRVDLHEAFLSFVPQVFRSISFRKPYAIRGWGERYRSFAIFEDDRIVANVSVQQMDLVIEGHARTGWQLGAVGVLPNERGRGLQRTLMNHVLDVLNPNDLVFLFANEDVLDFYPLFGFRRVNEWLYGVDHRVVPSSGPLRRLSIDSSADRWLLARIAAAAMPVTERFGARNYGDVLLWYWANFHSQDFHYHEHDDAIVIAERDMEVLRVLDVVASEPVDLASYLPQLVDEPVGYVEFGFTPERLWPDAVPVCEYLESPLFIRGDVSVPSSPFKFPLLAQT